jgi:hypothetical protein
MLGMPALELRHPIVLLILVKANDAPSRHGFRSGPGRISMYVEAGISVENPSFS